MRVLSGGWEGEWVGRLFHWAPVNSRCSQSPLQINSVQRRVFLVCSAFSLALCEGVYQPAKHSTLSKNKQTKHTHKKKNAASAVSQKRKIMKLKQCQCLKWCFLKTGWKKPKLFVFYGDKRRPISLPGSLRWWMSPGLLPCKSVCVSATCRAWRELQPGILDWTSALAAATNRICWTLLLD